MDSDDKFAISPLIIVCATVFGMACSLVSCGDEINTAIDASKEATQDASLAIEHANGCPLDAVAYDAPAFANVGSKSFRVTDRFSGASWWLVKMGRSWAVLPIMDVKEADVG